MSAVLYYEFTTWMSLKFNIALLPNCSIWLISIKLISPIIHFQLNSKLNPSVIYNLHTVRSIKQNAEHTHKSWDAVYNPFALVWNYLPVVEILIRNWSFCEGSGWIWKMICSWKGIRGDMKDDMFVKRNTGCNYWNFWYHSEEMILTEWTVVSCQFSGHGIKIYWRLSVHYHRECIRRPVAHSPNSTWFPCDQIGII